MESSQDNSYKSALKATSLFGGVQVFNIAIRIIRSKVVAVLLGPEGMGVVGLLRSTVELISSVTGCGLGQSSVRNIAEANASDDKEKVAVVITIFRKLIWITGIFGSIACAVFSPIISQITFGNHDYTLAFTLIAISVLFLQLTAGQNALLQGLQKYKGLAKANVYGSAIGLLITLPLYYFWHLKAIVPVLLSTYIIGFLCAYIIARKISIPKVVTTKQQNMAIGRDMLKLGLLLSASSILSQLTAYLVCVYIRKDGSLDDVGLYNAGFAIVNTYIGMIFTAMATDYYPRLAKVVNRNEDFYKTINQQAEITLLLLMPLIVIFVIFIKPVVLILYSEKFIPIEGMVYWTIAAMTFKALAWSLSFGLVTKGEMKHFAFCEFGAIIYGFVFNIIGYHFWGLDGLGLSFFLMYVVYFIHLMSVFRIKYKFGFGNQTRKIALIAFAVVLMVVATKLLASSVVAYIIGSLVLIAVSYFSLKEINNRVGFESLLRKCKK